MRIRAAVLLVVALVWGGATAALAAGTQIAVSHVGDAQPGNEGFSLGVDGDPLEALNHITVTGIADDQGFPVWAIHDATDLGRADPSTT